MTKTHKSDPSSEKKFQAFLSYSRKDLVFVDRLQTALEKQGIDVLIDREDIVKGEDWWERIRTLIMNSDTTIFILSPNSIDSPICKKEVDYTEKLNKRILPIVAEDISNQNVPEALARLEYTFFINNPSVGASVNFDEAVLELFRVFEMDIDWIREHTRICASPQRWDQEKRPTTSLLRGEELSSAEKWLTTHPEKAPAPTDLHIAYITNSRQADIRRKHIVFLISILVMAMAIGLSGIAYWQRRNAITAEVETKEQLRKNYWANALDSKENNDWLSLLHYSAKAGDLTPNLTQAKNGLYSISTHMTILLGHIFKHEDFVLGALFTKDEARILAWSGDDTARLWNANEIETRWSIWYINALVKITGLSICLALT